MDANMALWCVVPELRARGFMVCMTAFYAFEVDGVPMVDSLGIFAIGPTGRIKMVYSPTVVGKDVKEPQLGKGDGYTMGYLKSNKGGHIGEGWKHELEQHWDEPNKSPGYIWDSYQPKDRPQVRALFATNSCTVTRSMCKLMDLKR